jgi:hypothetical protein
MHFHILTLSGSVSICLLYPRLTLFLCASPSYIYIFTCLFIDLQTHTMEGPEHDRGVNLRALETVMELSASSAEDLSTTVHVSMLEVYNEKIRWAVGGWVE